MALVTYLVAPCSGGSGINVDFSSSALPVVGGNYYLTFAAGTTQGCYEVVDTAEPATGIDVVSTMSINYGDCLTCLAANPTPTPTPTQTATPTVTPTKTVTPTVTNTPSVTPTKSVTPTVTATPTITPTTTITPTPSITPTKTVTPTITPTTTATPTKTVTPTVTNTPSITPSITPTKTVTPTVTNTPSITPTITPTKTVTPTITPTLTPTPTNTPTPSLTPFFSGFSVDQQYDYTVEILGNFSGGSINEGGPADGIAPHPVYTDGNGVPYVQLNAITLGGVNGLNN